MAAVTSKAIAKQLLEIEKKVAPDLLKIESLKDKLRDLCTQKGESFTEEIADLGSVEVKAGKEAELKGTVPVLSVEAFLALPKKRQGELTKQKLVSIDQVWSKASKPSVTVRL